MVWVDPGCSQGCSEDARWGRRGERVRFADESRVRALRGSEGSGAEECRWLLKAGKGQDMDSVSFQRSQSCPHLDFIQ